MDELFSFSLTRKEEGGVGGRVLLPPSEYEDEASLYGRERGGRRGERETLLLNKRGLQ